MQLPILLVILSVAAVTLAKPAKSEASQLAVVEDVPHSSSQLVFSGSFSSNSTNLVGWGIILNNRRIDSFELFNVVGVRITRIRSGIDGFTLHLGLVTLPEPGVIFFEYRFYGEFLSTSGIGKEQIMSEEPRVEVTYQE